VLRVLNLVTGEDSLLAAEPGNDNVTWGLAEFIGAEEFGRYRGYWWSPDGSSVLAARVDNTRVRLVAPARPGRTRRPADDGRLPRRRHRERRGHAAPARPRRRLGRRALGP
jgi:dipeptidyl-peptidase-4